MKCHLKPNGVQMYTTVVRIYTLTTDDGRVATLYEANGPLTPEMNLELTEEQFNEMCYKYAGSKALRGEDEEDDEEW